MYREERKVEILGDLELVKGVLEMLVIFLFNVLFLVLVRWNFGGGKNSSESWFWLKIKKGYVLLFFFISFSISVGIFENLSLESIRVSSVVVFVFISIFNLFCFVVLN